MNAFEEFFHSHEELKNGSRSRKARSEIAKAIEKSASTAPTFEVTRGRLRYRPRPSVELIRERKSATAERYANLKALCARRQNELPELASLVDRYGRYLTRLRRDRGSFNLHLAGMEIETFIRVSSQAPADKERNPILDGDLLFAAQSLMVAHAALIVLFPDINRLAADIDSYLRQSEAIHALRDRVLDPVLGQLSKSEHIFDSETQEITDEIKRLDDQERQNKSGPSRAVTSSKIGWLRGSLAAMGRLLLDQSEKVISKARDASVATIVAEWAKKPTVLIGAIVTLFASANSVLLKLADSLPATFGWIRPLLGYLGFG